MSGDLIQTGGRRSGKTEAMRRMLAHAKPGLVLWIDGNGTREIDVQGDAILADPLVLPPVIPASSG